MKKLLLSIVAALLIISACNKSDKFKINLNIDNSDGQTVVLVKSLDGKKPIIMDTAVFADNKDVTVKGDLDDFFHLEATGGQVMNAYNEYQKGLADFMTAFIPLEEAAWLQAVEEDALPYIQVRDVEGEVSDDYAVVYIPSNYLYDQNGLMVAKGLRGEELEAKLAELLK